MIYDSPAMGGTASIVADPYGFAGGCFQIRLSPGGQPAGHAGNDNRKLWKNGEKE